MKLTTYFSDCYLLERDITEGTETHYQITMRSFSAFLERDATLADLNDETVNKYLVHFQRTLGRSPSTVRSNRADLLSLWRSAYESGFVDHAPRKIRRIKQPDRIPCSWTPLELKRIIAACENLDRYFPNGIREGDFWSAFVRLTYDTGLRLSDVLSLQMSAIDEQGRVHLVQQKSSRRHYASIRSSTLESLRRIPHPNGLALAFPYTRSSFWDHWRRLLKAAGLSTGRREGPQKLRRTSATEVSRIAGPDAASAHLGHSRHSHGLAEKNYLSGRAYPDPPLPPEVA